MGAKEGGWGSLGTILEAGYYNYDHYLSLFASSANREQQILSVLSEKFQNIIKSDVWCLVPV